MFVNAGILKNSRGVALIIVLLVIALLIALVFEFAYGTRVSLRAAANFRDSQRAYFLALSGVNYFKKNSQLRDYLPQGELVPVPLVSGDDTEVSAKWVDETGKISISTVAKGNDAYNRLIKLFDIHGVNQTVVDLMAEKGSFYLLAELHQFLTDEDFRKVNDSLTVYAVQKININTASVYVLQALGLDAGTAERIVERRGRDRFDTPAEINQFPGMNTSVAGQLDIRSTIYRVYAYATVGGYTKQVETVVNGNPPYWKAL